MKGGLINYLSVLRFKASTDSLHAVKKSLSRIRTRPRHFDGVIEGEGWRGSKHNKTKPLAHASKRVALIVEVNSVEVNSVLCLIRNMKNASLRSLTLNCDSNAR